MSHYGVVGHDDRGSSVVSASFSVRGNVLEIAN